MSRQVYKVLAGYIRNGTRGGWLVHRESSGLYTICNAGSLPQGQFLWVNRRDPHSALSHRRLDASAFQMRTILAAMEYVNRSLRHGDKPIFLEQETIDENTTLLKGRITCLARGSK